jgi:hypothetical protein
MTTKRLLYVPILLAAVPLLVAAAPRMLKGGPAGPGAMLDATEQCARDASYQPLRMGQMLRVSTPDATLAFSATLGDGLALMVTAPGGTPKEARPARVAVGQQQGDALWACAVAATQARKGEGPAGGGAPALLERLVDGLDTAAAGVNTSPSTPPSSGPPASQAVDGSCCVNGAFYECATLDAVNTCTGRFMTCQSGCGMDFGCIERCAETHPIDPSGCSRATTRDGECS